MLEVSEQPLWPEETSWLDGYPKGEGRRRKAALLLGLVWSGILLLHLSSVGLWVTGALAGVMVLYSLKLLSAHPPDPPSPLALEATLEATGMGVMSSLPFVSLVVAAKNEEAVITPLVERLCSLDYPTTHYELWVVDDDSSDRTPLLLTELAQRYPNLHWLRRSPGASGGKSGALNQVLGQLNGEFIGVFDADAQVQPDLLRAVLPSFANPETGAVQVRKVIANAAVNGLTRGQSIEMIFDSFLHERRHTVGGLGELRGNGQFVRRTALDHCGGWNEETITDDLDLTLRLHLGGWQIDSVAFPYVQEEGVTHLMGLWHQRNRWAEGGYQRYLDYWPLLLNNRMGDRKTFDLAVFWVLQYLLPTAVLPDTILSMGLNQLPVLLPLTSFTIALSFVGMWAGLSRIRRLQNQSFSLVELGAQSLLGTVYMGHWLLVVASVTFRMAIRPKRFNWVKTVHLGQPTAP